jgi:hypothetical protein
MKRRGMQRRCGRRLPARRFASAASRAFAPRFNANKKAAEAALRV